MIQPNFSSGNACGAVQLQSQIYNALESKQTHSRSTRSNTGLTNFVEWSRKNFPHGPISKPGFYKLSAAEMGKIYDDFTTKVIDHIRQQIACANMTAGGNIVKAIHHLFNLKLHREANMSDRS